MEGLKLVADAFGVLCSMVIIKHYFTNQLEELLVTKRVFYMISAACMVVLSVATLFPNRHMFLPLLNFSFVFLISFLFRKKWHIRFFYSILLSVFFLLAEEFVGAIMVLATRISIEGVPDNLLLYITGLLTSRLIVFLLVKIMVYRKSDIYRNMQTNVFIGLILTPISSIAAIAVIAISLISHEGQPVMLALLCTTIFLCVSNYFVFYLFENQMKNEHIKASLAVAKKQIDNYKEMSRRQTEIRMLSHDIKHLLSGVWGYINERKFSEANQCIKGIITNLEKADSVYDTGHSAIDAILHSKKQDMDKLDIRFDMFTALPEQIYVDAIDLCVILGNGLDNAIEACAKLPDEHIRFIRLNIKAEHKYIFIGIENPTNQDFDRNQIPKTTKPDNFYHGLGLASIRAVTDRYDGNLSVSVTEHVFSLAAMVKNM